MFSIQTNMKIFSKCQKNNLSGYLNNNNKLFMVGTESLSCYIYNDCKKRTLLGKSIAIAPTKSELLGLTDLFSSTSSGK